MKIRTVRHLALLAGMSVSFSAAPCAYEAGPVNFSPFFRPGEPPGQTPAGAPSAEHSFAGLRRKAEAVFEKAEVLRRKQTEKDLRRAMALFQDSARLFSAANLATRAADAHLRTGEIHFTLSEYDPAVRSYRHVLSLARTDLELRCQALSRMARSYATTGQPSAAKSYSEQALTLCQGLPNLKAQAEALEARGEALLDSGDAVPATAIFQQARERFAQAHDDDGQALAMLNLGYAHFFQADRMEGVRLAGEALALWTSSKNRDGVAQARAALGMFANVTGQWETAQCNYKLARPAFQEIGDRDNEAVALNGLGKLSLETGDAEASLDNYGSARKIFARVQDQLGGGEAITGMAKALSALRRYQELLQLYSAKLRQVRQAKNRAQEASVLADMAGVYQRERQYARAEAFYQQALATYRSAHHPIGEGDVLIRLAGLQAEQGNDLSAISFLESALPLKDQTAQAEDVARIHYELAYSYRRLNRLESARVAMKKTIEIIESQRLRIAQFDSRASYFASVHRYWALYIQVLMLLHREHPDGGFARMAFDAAEKSKVRSLLDLLTAASQNSSCDELLQHQLQSPHTSDLQPEASKNEPPEAPWKQAQAEIEDEDTILLEYALGDEKSYVWIVGKGSISVHELPSAERITKLAEAFRKTLMDPGMVFQGTQNKQGTSANGAAVHHSYARQLSQMLLGPVPFDRVKRLLIVPDGHLQYIPFAALPHPGQDGGGAYLVSRHELVVLPSSSALSALRKAAAARAPPTATAAIFADPVFEFDDPRVLFRHSSPSLNSTRAPAPLRRARRDAGRSDYIPRLEGSRNEAGAIMKTLGCRREQGKWVCPPDVLVRWDFDASRDYILKNGLGSFRQIHIATHGIIDARNPEMSGLILSLVNERGERQDGYLRLGDIYKLKLSADLVVLSSCDSALGKDLESEGVIGLPRGFLYAGARSVIASLWKVDDDATAALMRKLYVRMHNGESPSAALRGAQLEMAQDREWTSPFYWAGFVLQGDYR